LEDLAQHILDISFNSLEAGATKLEISIREDIAANILEFEVRDNGRGIAEKDISKVLDPFYTTKNGARTGLGIPLLHEAVERCGGSFEIKSLPQKGTRVKARFPHDHLDRAPLGDITGTLITLITSNEFLHLTYRHRYNGQTFSFNTKELKSMLKGISLQTPEVMVWLEEYLSQNIAGLRRAKDEKFGRAG